jgi:hypothetical protein
MLRCQKVHKRVVFLWFGNQKCKPLTGTGHSWTFQQRILHVRKSDLNVWVLQHLQKRWQAWHTWRSLVMVHFAWPPQHVGAQRRWFPEKGHIFVFEQSSFLDIIFRDALFRGRHNVLNTCKQKKLQIILEVWCRSFQSRSAFQAFNIKSFDFQLSTIKDTDRERKRKRDGWIGR